MVAATNLPGLIPRSLSVAVLVTRSVGNLYVNASLKVFEVAENTTYSLKMFEVSLYQY